MFCRKEEAVLSDLPVSFLKEKRPDRKLVRSKFFFSVLLGPTSWGTKPNRPEGWGLVGPHYPTSVPWALPEKPITRFTRGKGFQGPKKSMLVNPVYELTTFYPWFSLLKQQVLCGEIWKYFLHLAHYNVK